MLCTTNVSHADTVHPSHGRRFPREYIRPPLVRSSSYPRKRGPSLYMPCPAPLTPVPSADGKRSVFLGTRSLLLDSFSPRGGTTAAPTKQVAFYKARPLPFRGSELELRRASMHPGRERARRAHARQRHRHRCHHQPAR